MPGKAKALVYRKAKGHGKGLGVDTFLRKVVLLLESPGAEKL